MFKMHRNQAQDWRGKLAEVKAARELFAKHAGIMTDFEKQMAQESIEELRQQHRGEIIGAALAELNGALNKFQAARQAVTKARSKEIDWWDTNRLQSEMNLIETRVSRAIGANTLPGLNNGRQTPIEQVENIYNEMRLSNDIYKRRAAGEIFQSLVDRFPRNDEDGYLRANRLCHQARQELTALREGTDGINTARAEEEDAWQEYLKHRAEVKDVSQTLDAVSADSEFCTGEIRRAMRKVQLDRESGEIVILPDDSPEVTGISLAKLTMEGN